MTARGEAAVVRLKHEAAREYIVGSLWITPAAAMVVALIAGSLLSLVRISPSSPAYRLMFQGTADDARQVLIVVGPAMITVTGLVFSLTVVALQIASGQFSPRLLRNFLRDRPSKVVLAIFVATFAYSTAGLYTVGVSQGRDYVPRLAVSGSLVLAFASLSVLLWFFHHLARSIQLDVILNVATRRTLEVVDSLPDVDGFHVHTAPDPPAEAVPVLAPASGYMQTAHLESLVEVATRHDLVIRLVPIVGGHLVVGHSLAWVWRRDRAALTVPAEVEQAVADAILIGSERTLQQDAALGLRQLVDIAIKALSPAVNDPYTATMVVDRLTTLLCELAKHPLGDDLRRDEAGVTRVVMPMRTFDEYLALSCNQIRRYGAGEPRVIEALLDMLGKISYDTASPDRRASLARHVRLAVAAAAGSVRQREDVQTVRQVGEALLERLENPAAPRQELTWVRVS
jgi:uncharacterized membrane protein